VSWAEFFEVMTIIIQLVCAFLVIPACIVAGVILINRLLKMAAEELS
jgi:hypothetical protein